MSMAWLILAIVIVLLLIGCAYAIFRIFRNQKGFDTLYLSIAAIILIVFEVLLALTLFVSIYMAFK